MTTAELEAKRAEVKSLWRMYQAAKAEADARCNEWLAVFHQVQDEENKLKLLATLKAEGRLP